jgi:hypothetical protein
MTLQKIPIIGDHFVKEIPPSDNVRQALRFLLQCLFLRSMGLVSYFSGRSSDRNCIKDVVFDFARHIRLLDFDVFP